MTTRRDRSSSPWSVVTPIRRVAKHLHTPYETVGQAAEFAAFDEMPDRVLPPTGHGCHRAHHTRSQRTPRQSSATNP